MTENTLYKTAMNFYHGIEDTTELEYLGYKIQILKSITYFGEWGVVVTNESEQTVYVGTRFASSKEALEYAKNEVGSRNSEFGSYYQLQNHAV